jgi:hypothetical protein
VAEGRSSCALAEEEGEEGAMDKSSATPWTTEGNAGELDQRGCWPTTEKTSPCCSRSLGGGAGRVLGCCCARKKEQGASRHGWPHDGEGSSLVAVAPVKKKKRQGRKKVAVRGVGEKLPSARGGTSIYRHELGFGFLSGPNGLG